jgi:hypothetical protein
VAFSDQQRSQIEAMVAAGDTMGAQKIILAELSKEFGGAAKAAGDTFAGAQAKAAQSIEDVQEKLGAILLPVIVEVTDAFADLLTAVEPLIEIVGNVLAGAVSAAAQSLEHMVAPLQTLLDLIPEMGSATEDTSGSVLDYTKAIINIGNPISTFTGFGQKLHDIQNVLTNDFSHGTAALEEQKPVMDALTDAARGMYERFRDGTKVTSETEDATRHLTDAMRDQRLATLALENSFLGILDSARTLAEDQKELNRLQRQGKDDTSAYDDAVLTVIEDQIALEGAVLSYGKELVDAGGKQKEVEKALRDAAREAGVNQAAVRELIGEIRAYINELNRIPENVTTHIAYTTSGQGFQTGGGYQHGGVVKQTGLAMVHKGEVFSGVNNEMGFGPSVVVNVTGSVIAERDLVDVIRGELIRFPRRNPDVGF